MARIIYLHFVLIQRGKTSLFFKNNFVDIIGFEYNNIKFCKIFLKKCYKISKKGYFIYNKANNDIIYKSPDKSEVWEYFFKNCNEEYHDIKEFEDNDDIIHEYYCGMKPLSRQEFENLLKETI